MTDNSMGRGLVPYEFEGATVRVVEIDGEAHFVGKDVAEQLGYTNPNKAMNDHCKGVTKRHPLQTAGGVQDLRVLAEPDVLRLIVKSNLPAAERFERWVFEDVLPSIRKTGGYRAASVTADDLLANPKQLLAITQGYALQIEDMKRDMAVMQKDVKALDLLAGTEGSFGVRQSAKAVSMPERKFVQFVQQNRWCFRQRGSNQLLGYADKEKAGYLTHKVDTYTKPDGTEAARESVRFKMAGLVKLAQMLNVQLNIGEGE
ncbi:prophage antirepressor-like protein [Methylobacterium sp. RAS18]|nr:prophage antirepressor-like protein [Methylobacterium sp. RAS18]